MASYDGCWTFCALIDVRQYHEFSRGSARRAAIINHTRTGWRSTAHTFHRSTYTISTVRNFRAERQISDLATPNAYTGSVDFLYEPFNNTIELYPLVIEANLNRAPHRELDGNYTDLPVCQGTDKGQEAALCSDSATVTLVKSDRCPPLDITECIHPTQDFIWPELPVLRADNHGWRSLQHAQNSTYMNFLQNKSFQVLDLSWFSSHFDNSKIIYIERIRKRIRHLNAKIFLDVGRECQEAALLSGQQLMCPEEYPYVFGNQGTEYLRDCCKTDRDVYNNPVIYIQIGVSKSNLR